MGRLVLHCGGAEGRQRKSEVLKKILALGLVFTRPRTRREEAARPG